MKKETILLTFAFVLITLISGCSGTAKQDSSVPPSSSQNSTSSTLESVPVSSNNISSSSDPELSVPVSSQDSVDPILDQDLTDALNKFMLDHFGGSGDPKYAEFETSWYKYIDAYNVYIDGGDYIATLKLTEEPADTTVKLFLSTKLSEDNLEYCLPTILDVGAALSLDEVDMCLIGENIYKIIVDDPNLKIIYSSLYAYDIPVYKYLSDALEISEDDVRANIDFCQGPTAAQVVVDGMSKDYGGSFQGLTSSVMERCARTAIANFDDVYISEITVLSPDGKELDTYKNLAPKK